MQTFHGNQSFSGEERISPSDVKRNLTGTPWRDSNREIVAENILKLARLWKGDRWDPFTWEEYVRFRAETSPNPATDVERWILERFIDTEYLVREADGSYGFGMKLLSLYRQYCGKTDA